MGLIQRTGWLISAAVCLCACNATATSAELPSLPGTYWQLLSLTKADEPIKDAQNPADVEFLKDGSWGVLHYGGRREAGTYTVTGDRLVMKYEDGSEYNDAKMTYRPADQTLELRSNDGYLMRLRRLKPQ